MKTDYDLIIIGSGPGGYVAAIRGAQLGMSVAIIEKSEVGGVCLNWGCIPTKALLKNAQVYRGLKTLSRLGISVENASYDWNRIIKRSRTIASRLSRGVNLLFKKNNIDLIHGTASLTGPGEIGITAGEDSGKRITGTSIIIATGARHGAIPGTSFDGKTIISSREAMSLETQPGSLLIIGAGAIGVEFAYFYNAFGTRVTIVEMLPQLLPIEDAEIAGELKKSFQKSGIKIHTSAKVGSLETGNGGIVARVSVDGETKTLAAEKALVAIGVQGNTENLGLEAAGVETERGWIKVNERYETSVKGIYAIGDIIGPPWLAHVASAEGIIAVETIAGKQPKPLDYGAVPGCTYCQPQVASIGLTEQKALDAGYHIRVGRFPFSANGKSIAMGETEGLVKTIYDEKSGKLLGAHIIGSEATEMMAEMGIAKSMHATYSDVLAAVHAHPTLSEAIMESTADAYDEAIHI